jgi:tRNA (guanine-N7-)-methyltransferase
MYAAAQQNCAWQTHRQHPLLEAVAVTILSPSDRHAFTPTPPGVVFLQSDILRAAEGLRDAIEEVAPDAFELSPLHSDPSSVFFAKSSGGGGEPVAIGSDGVAEGQAGQQGGGAGEADGSEAEGGAADGEWSPDGWGGSDSDDSSFEPLFESRWARAGWLRDNPVGVPTEREHYVAVTQGSDIYRVVLVRR